MRTPVIFKLIIDQDGYPPVAYETLWCSPVNDSSDLYVLDSLPFFARDATCGDTIRAAPENGAHYYQSTVQHAGNSLIRVVYYQNADPDIICRTLSDHGCITEMRSRYRLIAVAIPRGVILEPIQAYLHQGFVSNTWDYEEVILFDRNG